MVRNLFSLIIDNLEKKPGKNLAVFTPQDFKSMFGHFSTLSMKRLVCVHVPALEISGRMYKSTTSSECQLNDQASKPLKFGKG